MVMFHRVIEITERVNTSAMVLKTVPDILTILCLRCKIGKSIGIYSANTRNKYRVFGFAER